ncbi:Qat anti-phage system TatD family nuclease QatD [Leptospira sp. SA-E8]|uniref:Qat anti-phage system TatD family nuclease QatD n=1 Tax=Leptospira sp. SA-E8 TaxID=3422259 RepID=UPI003EBC0BB7
MNVDMHCHLDLYPNPFYILEECIKRDLYILSVTTTPSAWRGTRLLSINNNRIKTALGLHPQLAHQRMNEIELFDKLLPEAKYIGEIGLDGGVEYKLYRDTQLKIFRHILKSINVAGGRIMTIHSRLSAKQVLDELRKSEGIHILHWFTGNKEELKRSIEMGCWFSVGPAMLNTKRGLEIASHIPRSRLLTETDGPFATENKISLMPWDVAHACKRLSELWGCSEFEAEEQIMYNLKNLLTQT